MKKFFAIFAAFTAVFTANAEELAPEQSQTQTNDTVVVYVNNPADIEYSQGMLASKFNYRQIVEEKGLRRWKVEGYVGNDVEASTFWSANREGLSIAAFGMEYGFDGHNSFGGGGEVNYLRKWVGGYAYGAVCTGYEARTSERYGESFTQFHAGAGILSPALEIKLGSSNEEKAGKRRMNPSVLSFRLYGEVNFKKCKDLKTDGGTTVTTQETEDEYIITTTKTSGNLDAKPHVWGWEIGARVQVDFGGSPLYLYGTAGWGKSQNFTYSEAQWHEATKVKVGIGYRIFNGHSYNKNHLRRAGYTEKDVKRWNW